MKRGGGGRMNAKLLPLVMMGRGRQAQMMMGRRRQAQMMMVRRRQAQMMMGRKRQAQMMMGRKRQAKMMMRRRRPTSRAAARGGETRSKRTCRAGGARGASGSRSRRTIG
jgi:hypothetical protein